jgi:hypothetical protein
MTIVHPVGEPGNRLTVAVSGGMAAGLSAWRRSPWCYGTGPWGECQQNTVSFTSGHRAAEELERHPRGQGSGISPYSGKTAARLAMMAWSTGSAGSYPDSKLGYRGWAPSVMSSGASRPMRRVA